MIALRLGKILNYGSDTEGGFDALSVNMSSRIFVLADGANSSPVGGRASQLAVDTVAHEIGSDPNRKVSQAFNKAHQTIKNELSIPTGTTCISLSASENLRIGSCGDSLVEIYTHHFILGWIFLWRSKLDLILDSGHPSQLLGSDVYYGASETDIHIKRRTIILMMTDGMYKFTSLKERKKIVSKVSRECPSNFDLEYLIGCIAVLAKKNGSSDDISGLLIWTDPKNNVEDIY
jgi:serine/threonine protein phosphatase PrpC